MSTSTSAAFWSGGSCVERGQHPPAALAGDDVGLRAGIRSRLGAGEHGSPRGVLLEVVGQRVGGPDLAAAQPVEARR